jgi:p-cumate 2,3-dioxygenase subunit beta
VTSSLAPPASSSPPPRPPSSVTSAEVGDFLSQEALLLDDWRLREWLGFFEPGATYHVPATDLPDGDPRLDQFLISDTWDQIQARVRRLESRNAHAERPRSRTQRMVTNALVTGQEGDAVHVHAAFMVHRMKSRRVATYIGTYRHVLAVTAGGLRFRHRLAVLDIESLEEEGRLSVII